MDALKDKVGVVGAGLMGTEITLIFALSGHPVTLCDVSEKALEQATKKLDQVYDRGAGRGLYKAELKESVLGLIGISTDLATLSDCTMVTEAVFEKQDVKANVLSALDGICGPDCIIATNTSTIPITVLASYVLPERRPLFIGTHYFSPVSRMRLVEVIPALETAASTVDAVMALCRAIGKDPIRIKDVTGFAVNRLLHVLMIEAVRLVEEGVASPADIDLACKLGLGHPMGPFELMDATTSSLCLQAQLIMFEAYGDRFRPRPLLKQRVQAGYVGGRGRPGWHSTGR